MTPDEPLPPAPTTDNNSNDTAPPPLSPSRPTARSPTPPPLAETPLPMAPVGDDVDEDEATNAQGAAAVVSIPSAASEATSPPLPAVPMDNKDGASVAAKDQKKSARQRLVSLDIAEFEALEYNFVTYADLPNGVAPLNRYVCFSIRVLNALSLFVHFDGHWRAYV